MRFGAFDIWGVSGAVKFLSISVTLGFCAHCICGLHGTALRAAWMLSARPPSSMRKNSCWRGLDIWASTFLWGCITETSQVLRAGWVGEVGSLWS